MAKGKKTGGRSFLPGNPGGPGKPKLPAEVKELNKITEQAYGSNRTKMTLAFGAWADASFADLNKFLAENVGKDVREPKGIVVELLVARTIHRTIQTGRPNDLKTLRFMMCGPEVKTVELSGPGGEPIDVFAGVSSERIAKTLKYLESQCQTPQPSSSLSSPLSDLESSPPDSPTES